MISYESIACKLCSVDSCDFNILYYWGLIFMFITINQLVMQSHFWVSFWIICLWCFRPLLIFCALLSVLLYDQTSLKKDTLQIILYTSMLTWLLVSSWMDKFALLIFECNSDGEEMKEDPSSIKHLCRIQRTYEVWELSGRHMQKLAMIPNVKMRNAPMFKLEGHKMHH